MTTGEELIQELDLLRKRLNGSKVEATNGLREAMGKDCEFFRMAQNKFLQKDYLELKDLVRSANQLFETVEGKQ